MKTLTTLFTGFGGADVGLHKAGFQPVQGFEWDDEIAEVARANGMNVKTADVTKLNPKKLESTYALHASPVCTNVSVANTSGKEEKTDIDAAQKVAEFITIWTDTKVFTMENVMPYAKTKSFSIICNALEKAKYKYRFFNMPFANYGVPQTRERLILLAHKDYMPVIPTPTHVKNGESNIFLKPWVGWYEAIEELIPTLPESSFAHWQLKRLGELDFFDTSLFPSGNANARTFSDRKSSEPSQTQVANGFNKAFLIAADTKNKPLSEQSPSPTVTSVANQYVDKKAFLLDGQTAYGSDDIAKREHNEPCFTLTATQSNRPLRAWLSQGRVVKLTPKANSYLQTFPKDYKLPDKKSLAQKGVGNAVPPLAAYHFCLSVLSPTPSRSEEHQ